eukprot:scaffold18835_cov67-Skeletonema_dohrnii-CCMP3373.AAC.2
MMCPVLLEPLQRNCGHCGSSPANKNNSYSREFVQYRGQERLCALHWLWLVKGDANYIVMLNYM